MNQDQARVLARAERVQRFLRSHSQKFVHVNRSRSRQLLDEVVTSLQESVRRQVVLAGAMKEAIQLQHRLAKQLVAEHLARVARVARLADIDTAAGTATFQVPRASERPDVLCIAARAMADVATSHARAFVAHGLESNFAARMIHAADALEEAAAGYQSLSRERRGLTVGVAAESTRACEIVGIIGALIAPQVSRDPVLAGQWAAARCLPARPTPCHQDPAPITPTEDDGGATCDL